MDNTVTAEPAVSENDIILAMQIAPPTGKGEFEGYVAFWGIPDNFDSIVQKGSFDEPLAAYEKTKLYPPVLWDSHGGGDVVGTCTLIADDKGLRSLGKFNLDDARGKWAYDRVTESQFYLSFRAGGDIKGIMTDGEGRRVYTKFLFISEIVITDNPGQALAAIDVVRTRRAAELEAARAGGYEAGLVAGKAEAAQVAAAEAACNEKSLQAAIVACLNKWAAGQ